MHCDNPCHRPFVRTTCKFICNIDPSDCFVVASELMDLPTEKTLLPANPHGCAHMTTFPARAPPFLFTPQFSYVAITGSSWAVWLTVCVPVYLEKGSELGEHMREAETPRTGPIPHPPRRDQHSEQVEHRQGAEGHIGGRRRHRDRGHKRRESRRHRLEFLTGSWEQEV